MPTAVEYALQSPTINKVQQPTLHQEVKASEISALKKDKPTQTNNSVRSLALLQEDDSTTNKGAQIGVYV